MELFNNMVTGLAELFTSPIMIVIGIVMYATHKIKGE